MWLLIAEALIVLAMGIFIVWWTMKSRRRNEGGGEHGGDHGGDLRGPPATPPVAGPEGAQPPAMERAEKISGA